MTKLSFTFGVLIFFSCLIGVNAQKNESKKKEEKRGGTGSAASIVLIENPLEIKREPYLGLEPCAKETPAQISELENAADKNAQVLTLVKRIADRDEWLRACAVYRLGEFRASATDVLPVVIKLLRDEENRAVWTHVEDALWKIPPPLNVPIAEKTALTKDFDVYKRLYGVYSLSYFKYSPTSNEAKDILAALIEAVKDDDDTVRWLAVMGIRQQGFYGVDTSAAIPVLSDLIKSGKNNPIHAVRAFVPMGEKALPAAALLFDTLYNPKKYAKDEADNNARSYGLYLTTAIALGRIGKPLLPFLEKEIENHPFEILQVLGNVRVDGTLPTFFKAMRHSNPKVRAKALENLPGLTSIGAVMTLPHLLAAVADKDNDVARAAMSEIGSIAQYTENKSDELKEMLRKKALPALVKKINHKELSCYALLNIADFGADGEPAIPAILKSMRKDRGNYCAESALFDLGEAGRKHLSPEKIKEWEKRKAEEKDSFNPNYNDAKPIKPKTEDDKKTNVQDGDG